MDLRLNSGSHVNNQAHEDEKYERLKMVFLTASFFCIIGSYSVIKELKSSIFAYMVGGDYIPFAKPFSMFALVPAIFIYSKLVDSLRRYWLLCLYSGFFAVMGLIFAYLLDHPQMGIVNTDSSPYRFFAWILYFWVEAYSPFVVSVFWSYANSVTSPEGAKKNYAWMVAGSKLGGVVMAGLSMLLLNLRNDAGKQFYSDVANHQLLLVASSVLLMMVPILITIMMRRVPSRYLHGYEAAYKVETKSSNQKKDHTGVLVGIKMLLRYPYVMGIFAMAFFYDVCATVLSWLSVAVAQRNSDTMSATLSKLLWIVFCTQLIGFLIAMIGTSALFRILGTRRCLLLIPISAGIAFLYFIFNFDSPQALTITFVALRSINYAFSWPLRESLYIPTVKDIKFKSKSWIDAFGAKAAKTSGSMFNILSAWFGSGVLVFSSFFSVIIGLWFVAAWLLGRKFDKAIKNNEVIGSDYEQ
ncbi:MAG TPA: Npt1/Npt2 family nucleotide transporter [Candidatus Babeliales bacterium]|nr:Npt1/Npt2 family nucleotide transporter [Candidatus Babeliales bacterium]